MRNIIRETTGALPLPGRQDRADAAKAWGSAEVHDGLQAAWPCLNLVEVLAPGTVHPPPSAATVAAWNIERCKHVEASAERISRAGADIVLATELDLGMARSGQRHTPRDLAQALGYGYAFGVEFVELGIGDANEAARFAGQSNRGGLHGNAILSRWPLKDVALLPLDDGGEWFVRAPKNDGQFRVGGRMAIAARIETTTAPLVLVSVHLESESDAGGRATQIERLLAGMAEVYGDAAAVIGGDLNTNALSNAGRSGAALLADPAGLEPCFAALESAGFQWRECNTGEVTTRRAPWAAATLPLKTLDWLFARAVTTSAPFVLPALSEAGDYLSDHELIGVRVGV